MLQINMIFKTKDNAAGKAAIKLSYYQPKLNNHSKQPEIQQNKCICSVPSTVVP
jgi:hypothetical protein